jgi:hypothetical protein
VPHIVIHYGFKSQTKKNPSKVWSTMHLEGLASSLYIAMPGHDFGNQNFAINKDRVEDIRSASHYGRGVKRTLYKLSSREQDRSPLKYTNCGVWISLEKKNYPFEENLGFHKYSRQTFIHRTNSWCQNSQKMLSCRHSGGHYPMAVNLQCEGQANKLFLSTNHIAGILCLLDRRPSVKCPCNAICC